MRDDPTSARASAALARVSAGLIARNLSIQVLDTESAEAFSFSDEAIYVARGLVVRLDDDELAATVAHELGHLLHDGVVKSMAALRGDGDAHGDIERIADALGRQLLISHDIPAGALPSALEKVAAASRGTAYWRPLEERARDLRRMDATAGS